MKSDNRPCLWGTGGRMVASHLWCLVEGETNPELVQT